MTFPQSPRPDLTPMTGTAGDEGRARPASLFRPRQVSGADALWTPALDNLTFKASSLLRFVIHSLFPGRVALVSSFGADSAVLLHIVAQINNVTPVGFVDTGRHFPETLAYRDELCARLRLTNVINAAPAESTLETDDPEQTLFASNPDHCCEIRKVRPLADALANYKG